MSNRFADNTTSNPVDRRRVYGFAPGFKYMRARPLATNLQTEDIPQGELILFKPRVDSYFNNDFRQSTMEQSPRHFADTVAAKFRHGGSGDFGFRILDCLTPLEYDRVTGVDEADKYFATVHPDHIGACEMGLETNVGRRFDKNSPSDPCPTCRLAYLESDKCTKAIDGSDLDKGTLSELRQLLIESYRAGILHARHKYDQSAGEVAARAAGAQSGKSSLDDADRHFMKMIHKKEVYIEQAELVAKQAEVQGAAMASSLKEVLKEMKEEGEIDRLKRELEEAKGLLAAKEKSAKKDK
jgi:hypothetical protein